MQKHSIMKEAYQPGTLVLMNGKVFKVEKFNGLYTYDIIQHPNGERSFKKVPEKELQPYMNLVN